MGRNRDGDRFARLAAWHLEVLTTGHLLVRCLAIQIDLFRRLSKRPTDKLLLTEQKRYDKLVCQLLWEHKTAIRQYRLAIRRLMRR